MYITLSSLEEKWYKNVCVGGIFKRGYLDGGDFVPALKRYLYIAVQTLEMNKGATTK